MVEGLAFAAVYGSEITGRRGADPYRIGCISSVGEGLPLPFANRGRLRRLLIHRKAVPRAMFAQQTCTLAKGEGNPHQRKAFFSPPFAGHKSLPCVKGGGSRLSADGGIVK